MLGLRDASLETWSSPAKFSKNLEKLHAAKKREGRSKAPVLHSSVHTAAHAAQAEEEKSLMKICQKAPTDRTPEEVQFTSTFMRQWHFFSLWPEAVQAELARSLVTEVRVLHETVISKGVPLTKVFFVLRGSLQMSVPEAPGENSPAAGKDLLHRAGAAGISTQKSTELAGSPSMAPSEFFRKASTLGDSTHRVLAQLKRGDTCGEALLLGTAPERGAGGAGAGASGTAGNGTIVSHADVTVNSAGAVMLSLTYADFLRALKEVLGLRQQDRMLFLRMHPLFVDVSLEDIDCASDFLQMSLFSPGSQIHPARKGDEPKIFFIAEGECTVSRRAGARFRSLHAAANKDSDPSLCLYDEDTISHLGPLDIFGLEDPQRFKRSLQLQASGSGKAGGGGGMHRDRPWLNPEGSHNAGGVWVVEAHSQVKVYSVAQKDFRNLPEHVQRIILDASDFKSHYLQGRLKQLARLDEVRRDPRYGSVQYKVGETTVSTMSAAVAAAPVHAQRRSSLGGQGSAARLDASTSGLEDGAVASASRGGAPEAVAAGVGPGSKLAATLEKLEKKQVGQMLLANAAREQAKAKGLVLSPEQRLLHLQQEQQFQALWNNGGSPTGHSAGGGRVAPSLLERLTLGDEAMEPPGSPALGPGSGATTARFEDEGPAAEADLVLGPGKSFRTQVAVAGRRAGPQQQPQQQAATTAASSPRNRLQPLRAGANAPPTAGQLQQQQQQLQRPLQQQRAAARQPRPLAKAPSAPLGQLPPDTKTWSRLEHARHEVVHTEPPRAQPVPVTLHQRHAAMFHAAQLKSRHRGTLHSSGYGEPDSDDEDLLSGQHAAMSGYSARTGRLSARLRHSNADSGSASASASERFSGRDGGAMQRWSPSSASAQAAGADAAGAAGAAATATTTWRAGGGGHAVDRDLLTALDRDDDVALLQEYDLGGGEHAMDEATLEAPGPSGDATEQDTLNSTFRRNVHHGRQGRTPETGKAGSGAGADSGRVRDEVQAEEWQYQQQQQQQLQQQQLQPQQLQQQQQQQQVSGLPPSIVLGYENLDPFQWAALMSNFAPGQRPQGAQDNVLPKPKW